MLSSLRIRNLALVEDLSVEFGPGLNIITGETGAGKSILIGALNLLLGERADRTMIRAGADSGSVEAIIEVGRRSTASQIRELLDANGLQPCEENQLILKRAISGSGGNRQFVNGSPATLNVLGAIGEWLVDIHGPHEHQSLLHAARQLDILDAYGELEPSRRAFADLVAERGKLEAQKRALIVDENTYAQQLDILRHQVREITLAKLEPQEEERVSEEYKRASNAAKLTELCQSALGALNGNEPSLLDQAGTVGRLLKELQRLDSGAVALLETHERASAEWQALQQALSSYAETLDVDSMRLQELETRLNVIQGLKRKYGSTVRDVIKFGEEAAAKLKALEERDAELERINAVMEKVQTELIKSGKELSARRRRVIPQLSAAVTKELSALGFKRSLFDISISTQEPAGTRSTASHFNLGGFDTIEFQFAPNPGEPPRPLRAIASSGELARVMLAIKTALANVDEVPVLIFDEVDANVGGETAVIVGEKMRRIAKERQVLCITHLPQVAAQASAHYLVTKHTKAGRTISEIHLLSQAQRVTEIARMLGGQTDAARQHAEALLVKAP